MGSTWEELKAQGAILAKGQRVKKEKPAKVEEIKEHLKCTNCGKPVAIKILDHCQCSIWEVGKRKEKQ